MTCELTVVVHWKPTVWYKDPAIRDPTRLLEKQSKIYVGNDPTVPKNIIIKLLLLLLVVVVIVVLVLVVVLVVELLVVLVVVLVVVVVVAAAVAVAAAAVAVAVAVVVVVVAAAAAAAAAVVVVVAAVAAAVAAAAAIIIAIIIETNRPLTLPAVLDISELKIGVHAHPKFTAELKIPATAEEVVRSSGKPRSLWT